MDKIVYTRDEALQVVAGDKFYNALFDDIADQVSASFLINLGNKMNVKVGDLYNLDPNQLSGLLETLQPIKDDGTAEKNAYDNVCEAIDKKIELFNQGKINIPLNMAEDMHEMINAIQKIQPDKKEELYDVASKKVSVLEVKEASTNDMPDLDRKRLEQVSKNLERTETWHTDVTHLHASSESEIEIMSEQETLDFIKNYSKGEEISFSQYASLFVSTLKNPELNKNVRKNIEAKVERFLKSSRVLSGSEIRSAIYLTKHLPRKEQTREQEKLWNKFTKRIHKSIKAQKKRGSLFAPVQDIIDNTVVKGANKEIIPQKDKDGRLKPDSHMALWLEEVRDLTVRQEVVADKKLTKDDFDEAYVSNIETEYAKLVGINNQIAGTDPVKAVAKGKKVTVDEASFIGYSAAQAAEREVFVDKLIKKIDKFQDNITDVKEKTATMLLGKSVVEKFQKNSEILDKKAYEKGGELYSFAKTISKAALKSAKWGVAFGAAATLGPGAVSLVGAASFINYGYPFIKEYRRQKKELQSKGKDLPFRKYIAQNKTQTAALALGAVSAVAPIASVDLVGWAKSGASWSIAISQARNSYQEERKSGTGKLKSLMKAGTVLISAYVSTKVGAQAVETTMEALEGVYAGEGGRGGGGKNSKVETAKRVGTVAKSASVMTSKVQIAQSSKSKIDPVMMNYTGR